MIVRSWRGRATLELAPAYRAHLLETVLPALREIAGFHGLRVLERPHPAGVEVVVMTEWASWDAIRAFAGATPEVAVVEPAAAAVLVDFDTHVEHFTLRDVVTAPSQETDA